MIRYKQNLLPDEMQDIPIGAENVTPWINPDANIITIGTPEGVRYIPADNLPPGPPPFETMPSGDSPGVVAAELAGPSPEALDRFRTFQRQYDARNAWRNLDPNYDEKRLKADRYYREDKDRADREMAFLNRVSDRNQKFRRDFYPTPEEDRAWFDNVNRLNADKPTGPTNFTNIPGTADQWAQEKKSFGYLTNTPEETKQAKQKGYGQWGKIIGPPESALPTSKPRVESPYPGPPPSDEQTVDLKKFGAFWDNHVQKFWNGVDPLKINAAEAREAVTKSLKDQNAQFIYDFEKYGARQMGEESAHRYALLQKQIKEAGDFAEAKAKEMQSIGHREQVLALDFWKQNTKTETPKIISGTDEKGQFTWNTGTKVKEYIPGTEVARGQGMTPEKEALYKSLGIAVPGKGPAQSAAPQVRSIEKGLNYMKGITDQNEIIRRARVLAKEYGWSKDELNRLGKEMGL
jgi:hypothetical protein